MKNLQGEIANNLSYIMRRKMQMNFTRLPRRAKVWNTIYLTIDTHLDFCMANFDKGETF